MNGIDISRYQKGINLGNVPCDFVIVKATQGTSYVSKEFSKQITDAVKHGKKIGVYHYAGGGGYRAEADHFLNVVKDYIGQAILVLDWERDQNMVFGNHGYAVDWLRYVYQKTNIHPFIYMSKSVCREYMWDASFPLWVAQYKNKKPTGYQDNPWTDGKSFGAWDKPLIFQYTSTGRLPNYGGDLDLDKSYIPESEWELYCKPNRPIFRPLLKKGSRGEHVVYLQTKLTEKGFPCVADGIFGIKTEQSVKDFQKANIETCVMIDGIVGAKTWKAIES
jgi:lysozyme